MSRKAARNPLIIRISGLCMSSKSWFCVPWVAIYLIGINLGKNSCNQIAVFVNKLFIERDIIAFVRPL